MHLKRKSCLIEEFVLLLTAEPWTFIGIKELLMEKIILWSSFIVGVAMLFLSLRKLPLKDWLIIFLFTSYISVIAGTVVVEEKMLSYPVKILEKHFESSLQFEMLTLPVVCLYFLSNNLSLNIYWNFPAKPIIYLCFNLDRSFVGNVY